jgi:hypothetical protein
MGLRERKRFLDEDTETGRSVGIHVSQSLFVVSPSYFCSVPVSKAVLPVGTYIERAAEKAEMDDHKLSCRHGM